VALEVDGQFVAHETVESVKPNVVSEPGGWSVHAVDDDVHVKRPRFGQQVNYEEKILRDIAHPNVINLVGTNADKTELYIEKGDMDLYDYIATMKDYQVPTEELHHIAEEACLALAHVHSKGYAHNDIKVENVVLCPSTENGVPFVPKLIDFEFAHKLDEAPPEGDEKVAGTRAYFSPEKERDDPSYCRQAADMWALGVTLHLASYGCFPNGSGQPLPILSSDFKYPRGVLTEDAGTVATLGSLMEGLLKQDPSLRMTAEQACLHLNSASVKDSTVDHKKWRLYGELQVMGASWDYIWTQQRMHGMPIYNFT